MRTLFLTCFVLTLAWGRTGGLIQRAPARTAGISNPVAGEERAQMAGAKLYFRECSSCHGVNGTGAGKAPPLNRPDVYRAPPGALFWVLRNGSLHTGMPSFAHLPAQQRWQIVAYLQSVR